MTHMPKSISEFAYVVKNSYPIKYYPWGATGIYNECAIYIKAINSQAPGRYS